VSLEVETESNQLQALTKVFASSFVTTSVLAILADTPVTISLLVSLVIAVQVVTGARIWMWIRQNETLSLPELIGIAIATFPLATELVKQWGSPSISSNAFRFLVVILVVQTVSGGLLWPSRPHLPRKNTDRGFVEWIPKTQLAILPNNQRFITPGETDQCGRVLLCTKSIHSNITPYTILGRTGYKTDPST